MLLVKIQIIMEVCKASHSHSQPSSLPTEACWGIYFQWKVGLVSPHLGPGAQRAGLALKGTARGPPPRARLLSASPPGEGF